MTTPKKPADRPKKKSVDARRAEADGFVEVESCGITLKIPVGEAVPFAAYLAFKDDDEMLGTKLLLGEDQWNEWTAQNPTIGDFAAIGSALAEVLGGN